VHARVDLQSVHGMNVSVHTPAYARMRRVGGGVLVRTPAHTRVDLQTVYGMNVFVRTPAHARMRRVGGDV